MYIKYNIRIILLHLINLKINIMIKNKRVYGVFDFFEKNGFFQNLKHDVERGFVFNTIFNL